MISHPFSRWLECFFCTPDSIWIHLPWKLTGLSHAKCSPQLSQGRSTTELTALLSLQYVCGCLQIWNPVFNTGLISFLTRTSRYWYDLSCLHSLFADHPAFCSFSVLHIHRSPKPRFRAFALPTFFFFLKEISCSSLLLSLLIIPFPCPLLLYLGYFPRDSVSYKLQISLWATDIQMYVFSRSKACSIIKKKKAYTRFLGMIRCVEFMKYLKTAPLTFHVGWRETEHGDETVIWRMHKRDYEEE